MALTVKETCVSCGTCLDVCPTNAIYEGDLYFEIDEDACIECGACRETCPTASIE